MKKLLLLCCLLVVTILSAQVGNLPDCYLTNEEIVTQINQWETQNPDICKVEVIGYTEKENMPIHAVRLTQGVGEEHPEKPCILLNGQIHAEEVLAMPIVMKTVENIIANKTRPPYNFWLQQLDIWVIPVVNVEGYQVINDGLDLSWRKNKHDVNDNGVFDYTVGVGYDVDGVDNNRNFHFNWCHGDTLLCSSGLERYDYYRGASPASEKETQAIYNFVEEHKPIFGIQWHSSRTGNLSEKVYFPWNWFDTIHSPDFDIIESIAKGVADPILKSDQSSSYEYSGGRGRKGSQDNSLYQKFGMIQVLVECGTADLQPELEGMTTVVNECNDGIEWLLNRALANSNQCETNSMLTGCVTNAVTGEPVVAAVKVVGRDERWMGDRLTESTTGRFWRPLLPGSYTLEVSADGYETQTVEVNIFSVRTTRDIELQPKAIHPLTINVIGAPMSKITLRNDLGKIVYAEKLTGDTHTLSLADGEYDLLVQSPVGCYVDHITMPCYNYVLNITDNEAIFTDSFDDLDNWTATDNWKVVTSDIEGTNEIEHYVADSPQYNFNINKCGDPHNYDNSFYQSGCDVTLTTTDAIAIPSGKYNYIRLKHWLYTDWDNDIAYVEYSENNTDWIELWHDSGVADSLHYTIIPIPESVTGDIYFRLRLEDDALHEKMVDPGWNIDEFSVWSQSAVATPVEDNNAVVPVYTYLYNNYPNPFNPETTISYTLAKSGNVSLNVYNIKGQKVRSLVNENQVNGTHSVVWNGNDNRGNKVSSGVYFYRLSTPQESITKKMVLMK